MEEKPKKVFRFAPNTKENTGAHPPGGRRTLVPRLSTKNYLKKHVNLTNNTNLRRLLEERNRHKARKSIEVQAQSNKYNRNEGTLRRNMPAEKFRQYARNAALNLEAESGQYEPPRAYNAAAAQLEGLKMSFPSWRGSNTRRRSRHSHSRTRKARG